MKSYKKFLAEFEKRKFVIEKDTSRIVLAIVENVFSLDSASFKYLSVDYKEIKLKNHSSEFKKENTIDLSKFRRHKKYPFELGAVISCSKIYFDKDKKRE